jgi:hypothetical protein
MKILETLGAQGEIRMFRIDKIPAGAKPIQKEPGETHYVIGHSETGHHHVLVGERVRVFEPADAPEGMRILYAILNSPGQLTHLRSYDTHAPHAFEAGDIIMFRRDREFDPYSYRARGIID